MKARWFLPAMALMSSLPGIVTAASRDDKIPMTPDEAISRAATADTGTTGIFQFAIKGVGRSDGSIFLDSEQDYRDPASLNVEVLRSAQKALLDMAGGVPEKLIGRTVLIRGTARRVTVRVHGKGHSDSYYYQTQVTVTDARQITIEP